MNQTEIINKTVEYVRQQMSGEGTGHDWWHVFRVAKTAVRIALREQADIFIVQLAALLHDIGDFKFHNGDETVGPRMARQWLEQLGVGEDTVTRVCEIVREVSFKGAGVPDHMPSIEGKIVQDADRLDAIGAIGIARTFAYGGAKGREIHNPECKPQLHDSFEQYKKNNGPTTNHFYEKLLLLKDRMHTSTAKEIAEKRHAFMENFLEQFLREWDGEGF